MRVRGGRNFAVSINVMKLSCSPGPGTAISVELLIVFHREFSPLFIFIFSMALFHWVLLIVLIGPIYTPCVRKNDNARLLAVNEVCSKNGSKLSLKDHGSRKLFVEFHGCRSLVL